MASVIEVLRSGLVAPVVGAWRSESTIPAEVTALVPPVEVPVLEYSSASRLRCRLPLR